MTVLAIVLAGDDADGDQPPGVALVGGTTIIERQVRQALAAGIHQLVVMGETLPAAVAARLAAEDRCRRARDVGALARIMKEANADEILLFQPGLVVDERLVKAVVARPGPLLATFGDVAPAGAERLDSQSHWAGLLRMPLRNAAAVVAELGDWDLVGTLVRSAIEAGIDSLPVASLPTYAPARRRHVDMLWALPADDEARRAATEALIAAAQKGVLDWPARFIHPPIENGIVRLVLNTVISPNMITIVSGVLGAVGIALFATGWLWSGLIVALVLGPLDGIDGKLARVRHQYSRWGDLEHVLDKILEYGCFLAMGWWFAGYYGIAAWLVTGGIIIFAFIEAINGEFYRRFTGAQIDDRGRFERRFRLFAGRRNTFFWSLLPFAALALWQGDGWWWTGYVFLLAYATVTLLVAHWRFLVGIADYGRDHSAAVADNFTRTAYAFLPKGKAASR